MTEEYFADRERDLLDYLRNEFTDPENRITTITKTFTATNGQSTFVFPMTRIKNVADTLDIDGTEYRKGYHYTVQYGEGDRETTILTLNSNVPVLTAGQVVTVDFASGPSAIEREFSRADVKLPRVVLKFLTMTEEPAGLGDQIEDGLGSYMNVSYRIEVRDSYATRARQLTSELFNICRRLRHRNLFRTNLSGVGDVQNFDYDNEKEAYVWQFTLDLQWEGIFE